MQAIHPTAPNGNQGVIASENSRIDPAMIEAIACCICSGRKGGVSDWVDQERASCASREHCETKLPGILMQSQSDPHD